MTQIKRAKAILRNYHALKERRYCGDTNASDMLIDFKRAIKKAELTARQSEALHLVYGEDLTQASAGKRMNIAQKNVSELLNHAIDAIDEVYEYWAWHSGELTPGDFIEEMEAA